MVILHRTERKYIEREDTSQRRSEGDVKDLQLDVRMMLSRVAPRQFHSIDVMILEGVKINITEIFKNDCRSNWFWILGPLFR